MLSVFLRSALYGTVVKDEFLPIDRATKKKKRDKVAASLNISMEGGHSIKLPNLKSPHARDEEDYYSLASARPRSESDADYRASLNERSLLIVDLNSV